MLLVLRVEVPQALEALAQVPGQLADPVELDEVAGRVAQVELDDAAGQLDEAVAEGDAPTSSC